MFDNMASFFQGNKFSHVIIKNNFSDPVFHNTWNMPDKGPVVREGSEFFNYNNERFFALALNILNHASFEFPKGHILLFERSPNAVIMGNAIKYSNYTIGKFSKLEKKGINSKNPIFLIVIGDNVWVCNINIVPTQLGEKLVWVTLSHIQFLSILYRVRSYYFLDVVLELKQLSVFHVDMSGASD